EDDVAAPGTEGHPHRICQAVDPAEDRLPGLVTVRDLLRHALAYFLKVCAWDDYASTARTSSSRRIRTSSPSILMSVPVYFPKRILLPTLTSSGSLVPFSRILPFPTARTSPFWGFSFAVSGMMMPPLAVSLSSMRRTSKRSCSGRTFIMVFSYGSTSPPAPPPESRRLRMASAATDRSIRDGSDTPCSCARARRG